jgi:hypothetical protein
VLVHNLVQQTTHRDMFKTTSKANIHEILFYLVQKVSLDPHLDLSILCFKQGYRSWGVTWQIS